MDTSLKKLIEASIEAENIYERLKNTSSISEISDIIEKLDEATMKIVLKKFIYGREAD